MDLRIRIRRQLCHVTILQDYRSGRQTKNRIKSYEKVY